MDTAQPAAWPAITFQQFFACSLDAARASFDLFGVFDPTDKLVARKRRNIFPERQHFCISKQSFPQITWQFVHRAIRNFLCSHTLILLDNAAVTYAQNFLNDIRCREFHSFFCEHILF